MFKVNKLTDYATVVLIEIAHSDVVRSSQHLSDRTGIPLPTVAKLMNAVRHELTHIGGHSAGVVLDREVDVSRGDWLLADTDLVTKRDLQATLAWMDDTPLEAGRVYWALHGRRWIKAKVSQIEHRLDIQTLSTEPALQLRSNEIGRVRLQLQQDIPALPFVRSRDLGAMVLVDTASHRTSAAVLID